MARRRSRGCLRILLSLAGIGILATLLWCRQRTPATTRLRPPVPPQNTSPRSDFDAGTAPHASSRPPVSGSPWDDRASCESHVAAGGRLPRSSGRVRLATWNIRWFPYGEVPKSGAQGRTDTAWLACALAWLDADAIALQEVVRDERGQRAMNDLLLRLGELTGSTWHAGFDDCPGSGRQHVGMLVNVNRAEALESGVVASVNPGKDACALNLRPGYGAYLRWPGGPDLHFVSVHLDSGTSARDFGHRGDSLRKLGDTFVELQARMQDSDVVVAGDLNTMGCEQRKGCDAPGTADEELRSLDRLVTSLSTPFRRISPDYPCTEYYHGKGQLLDHFLVSSNLQELPPGTRTSVQGTCALARCGAVSGKPAAYEQLSDHCPVVLDLPRGDVD